MESELNWIEEKESVLFSCFLCHTKLASEPEFLEHLELHKNVPKTNKNSQEKDPEVKMEIPENFNDNFMCVYCNEEFDQQNLHDKHVDSIHPNPFEFSDFSDSEDSNFEEFPLLIELRETDIESPNTKWKCHVCFMQFEKPSSLQAHYSTHTDEIAKPHKCSIKECSKRFVTRRDLKNHEFTHFPNKPKPHKCSYCQKSFIKKIELTRHLYGHEPKTERPRDYKCSDCDKAFTFRSDLRKHSITHQSKGVRERKHHCHLCDHKSFYRSEHLKRHILSMHREEAEAENLYHSCKFCKRKFISQLFMQKHLLTHKDVAEESERVPVPS